MLLPEQSRAARAVLGWSRSDLATTANVTLALVRDFEAARRVPSPPQLAAMREALEAEGIEFLFNPDAVKKDRLMIFGGNVP